MYGVASSRLGRSSIQLDACCVLSLAPLITFFVYPLVRKAYNNLVPALGTLYTL
jgi:hypothetical protein